MQLVRIEVPGDRGGIYAMGGISVQWAISTMISFNATKSGARIKRGVRGNYLAMMSVMRLE